MKKITLLLLILVSTIVAGCISPTPERQPEDLSQFEPRPKPVIVIPTKITVIDKVYAIRIFDILHEGNRHEFVTSNPESGGLTHWPSCKYCYPESQKTDTLKTSNAAFNKN